MKKLENYVELEIKFFPENDEQINQFLKKFKILEKQLLEKTYLKID